jgi:hypothetical protein
LHALTYYIFLKSLMSLEEFRKNPHVKIPSKSPSTNFQSLGKFKNPIFNSEILFLVFSPADLAAPSASGLASPLAAPPPQAKTVPAGPSSPRVGRIFMGNTSSLLVRAFRAGRLSHVSLSTGPQLLVPSPTSNRPSSPAPPPIPGHRAPPRSAPRVPPSRYHLAFISPPLISLLNPPPSSMALKPLTLALTAPATPPRRSPGPYKRRAPPPSSTTPSPISFPLSPRLSSVLTERRHLPVLHRRRPASTAPLELR